VAPIPPESIQEIRSRSDIERVVSRYLALTRKGDRSWGICPFHAEKTPSFSVSSSKGLFHCFGCQAGGDVFAFLMRVEGLEFPEAAERLAEAAGVEIPRAEETEADRGRRKQLEAIFSTNAFMAKRYAEALEQSDDALRYLREERGVTDQSIAAFQLGFAPDGWSFARDALSKAGLPLEIALQSGLLGKHSATGRIFDRLRAQIVFPIRDPRGRILGFGSRRADWIHAEGPKYLNSPESLAYDKAATLYGWYEAQEALRKTGSAVVVEGYLDVILLWQSGIKNVVANCGTALTSKHAGLLRRGMRDVVALYDGDEAGRNAARRAAIALLSQGLRPRIGTLPDGEDPDSYVRAKGLEAMNALIAASPDAIDFFLNEAQTRFAGGGVAAAVKSLEYVKPLIEAIRDPMARDVSLAAAERSLGIGRRILAKHFADPAPQAPQTPENENKPGNAVAKERRLPVTEVALLKRMLEDPKEVVDELNARDAWGAFRNEAIRSLMQYANSKFEAGEPIEAAEAVYLLESGESISPEAIAQLRGHLLEALPESDRLSDCVNRLLERHRRDRLRIVRKQLESEQEPEAVATLMREANRLMALERTSN
jgi:DNA primase